MPAGRQTTSLNKHWCTPPKYVASVRQFFGGRILLDPCSCVFSTVGAETEYRLPEQDGLSLSWNFKTIYVNPPYGYDRERGTHVRDWLRRCAVANDEHRSEIIALVPVATNTAHWKNFVFPCARAVCFLSDTRVKFWSGGAEMKKGAPMACALIYWGSNIFGFRRVFVEHGAIIDLAFGGPWLKET